MLSRFSFLLSCNLLDSPSYSLLFLLSSILPGLSLNILNVALLDRSSTVLRTELLVLTARTFLLVLVLTACDVRTDTGADEVRGRGWGSDWECERGRWEGWGWRLSELAWAAVSPPNTLLSLPLSSPLLIIFSFILCVFGFVCVALSCVVWGVALSSSAGFDSMLFK